MISRYPVIGEIRDRLYDLGAVYASMSGSGSSVYGLFNEKAPTISNQFPGFFCWPGPVLKDYSISIISVPLGIQSPTLTCSDFIFPLTGA